MNCRHCASPLALKLIDLGTAPPSNAYLTPALLASPERWYPLRVLVCTHCWLAQTEDFTAAGELFAPDYAYFSSYSSTWLEHCEKYVAETVDRFNLDSRSRVIEVAANDGYLLQYVQARGIPCLGIEPTANTAAAARRQGLTIIEEFFGERLARVMLERGQSADLLIANNVLGHVPDINDFVKGFSLLLKPSGVATFEFPHLLRLVAGLEFDTIYHEHFSYLSLIAVKNIFESNGLRLFDVSEIPTHGGSLRLYACRLDCGTRPESPALSALLQREISAGLAAPPFYSGFQTKAEKIKDDLLRFLIEAKYKRRTVAAYGAAAKGNTLLNFAGIRPDLLPYVVDRNPAKQGKFLPGSRIPIVAEDVLRRGRPDYVLVLPWNLRAEITTQLDYIREWGGRFVIALPELEVI